MTQNRFVPSHRLSTSPSAQARTLRPCVTQDPQSLTGGIQDVLLHASTAERVELDLSVDPSELWIIGEGGLVFGHTRVTVSPAGVRHLPVDRETDLGSHASWMQASCERHLLPSMQASAFITAVSRPAEVQPLCLWLTGQEWKVLPGTLPYRTNSVHVAGPGAVGVLMIGGVDAVTAHIHDAPDPEQGIDALLVAAALGATRLASPIKCGAQLIVDAGALGYGVMPGVRDLVMGGNPIESLMEAMLWSSVSSGDA